MIIKIVRVDSGADLQLNVALYLEKKLTVFTFNKHDIQDFERINYDVVARSVPYRIEDSYNTPFESWFN